MNELQIFNNPDFGQIRIETKGNKTDYYVNDRLIDQFELLACAAEYNKKEDAWKIMNAASILFHPQNDFVFNSLYGCVAMEITRNYMRNELYYQKLFKEKYPKIVSCKIIKKKNDGINIPDAWVKLKQEIIPVEVKLHNFDSKALKQLQRYIKAYNCKSGIAVGEKLTVTLPSNIQFISITELENA